MTPPANLGREQEQFLEVIDRDEADRRFRAVLSLDPLGAELVPLSQALGRVLSEDVAAPVDVPGFDRSNMDGYAVRAADTFGAQEERPRFLRINSETLATGVVPQEEVGSGTATVIATGGMLPRGADAVVMVEHTAVSGETVQVFRPVAPGAAIAFAGSDIGRGELVLRQGERLSSRETGVLAALGLDRIAVYRRPRVAILSTGDELIPPGQAKLDTVGDGDPLAHQPLEPSILDALARDEPALILPYAILVILLRHTVDDASCAHLDGQAQVGFV